MIRCSFHLYLNLTTNKRNVQNCRVNDVLKIVKLWNQFIFIQKKKTKKQLASLSTAGGTNWSKLNLTFFFSLAPSSYMSVFRVFFFNLKNKNKKWFQRVYNFIEIWLRFILVWRWQNYLAILFEVLEDHLIKIKTQFLEYFLTKKKKRFFVII